jgi:acylphosphatase
VNVIRQEIAHVVIRGRVQGVGYRAFVEDEATRLGLQGWVRNRRDGAVEALFSGSEQAVRAMVELCRKGPIGARIEHVEQREGRADELALKRPGKPFSVLASA